VTGAVRQVIDLTNVPLNGQVALLSQSVVANNNPPSLYRLPGDRLGVVRFTGGEWSTFPLEVNALNARLMAWVNPQRVTTGRNAAVMDQMELPQTLVKAYIEEQNWPGVPRIQRLAVAPVVRPDWSICWDAGYDAGSEVFVTAPGDPMAGEVFDAARVHGTWLYLKQYFDSFAFEHESSVADCLGLALTPLIIGALPPGAGIPGGVMTANHPGSGKTKLAEAIALMGAGVAATPQTLPAGQQMKTHITTLLNSGGKPVVIFDNIKASLDSDALESLLTSRTWMDRKFRTQDDVVLRNDTQWLFTLNNATASPDMMRRLVMVPLDTNKSPAIWNPNALADIAQNLTSIRTALAVLVRFWVEQGRPRGKATRAGFEDWFETVSGILECAGVEGFNAAYAETVGSVYSADEDIADLIDRIGRVMGPGWDWRSSDLWDKVNDIGSSATFTSPDVLAIQQWLKLSDSTGERGATIAIGRKLKQLTGKRLTGATYYIEDDKYSTQSRTYRVIPMPGVVVPTPPPGF
jgi:hypothetical protein